VTADPLARITPPLPYFHSSNVPPAEEWRNGSHPSLQNMSLHEALQLRELLRARVRALHRAHMDALEGLRRRQWEIEKERQAYDSAYPEWTRQQYEEMQPLQEEHQYEDEPELQEETGSSDIPLTVPSLSPYWYGTYSHAQPAMHQSPATCLLTRMPSLCSAFAQVREKRWWILRAAAHVQTDPGRSRSHVLFVTSLCFAIEGVLSYEQCMRSV